MISELGGQRQVDLYEFEASLGYRMSSRTPRATQGNLVLKSKPKTKNPTNQPKENRQTNKTKL